MTHTSNLANLPLRQIGVTTFGLVPQRHPYHIVHINGDGHLTKFKDHWAIYHVLLRPVSMEFYWSFMDIKYTDMALY